MSERLIGAILGTGSIGSQHLLALHRWGQTPMWAIPLRPDRRDDLERLGYSVCESLPDAVAHGASFAIIATDTRRHSSDAMAAFVLGLHVLAEKPLAVNAAEAWSLARQAKAMGRQAFVGCLLRFSESLNAFRNQLTKIGRVHSVRIECQSYLPDWRPDRTYRESYSARADEGGVLRDLIHDIDYACWLFGWPKSVQAKLRNTGRLGIAAEESADLLWESDATAVISVSLDYLSRLARRRMVASGEFGTLTWDGIASLTTLVLVGNSDKSFYSAQTREEMLLAQDLAFIRVCSGEVDSRLASFDDGARALAVCDAARRAAEMKCEVEVEYL